MDLSFAVLGEFSVVKKMGEGQIRSRVSAKYIVHRC